ncbi:Uncharacterised protein [Mycobacteroides abscessus subsp. abscessus]|nr:Uncharacterised protein [Mycobacteroides abscessus subsp. abscessus]
MLPKKRAKQAFAQSVLKVNVMLNGSSSTLVMLWFIVCFQQRVNSMT